MNLISSVCQISIDEQFIGDYDDMPQKISDEMDDGYPYKKVKHGKQIIDHMYENGKRIEPVEEFLQYCIDEI